MSGVLLLSGGLDSAVLLAREVGRGRKPLCLSLRYGQRHVRELEAAEWLAGHYGVQLVRGEVPPGVLAGSSLTGSGDVPLDLHFADPGQVATVVPNRNLLFLSLAGAVAVGSGLKTVLFSAHAGDAAVYPDCRPEFVAAADRALGLACGVGVEAPFLAMTKGEIVALGRELGVPLERTWSCYLGGEEPCGRCGACVERGEAGA